jgi:hypothetical protein
MVIADYTPIGVDAVAMGDADWGSVLTNVLKTGMDVYGKTVSAKQAKATAKQAAATAAANQAAQLKATMVGGGGSSSSGWVMPVAIGGGVLLLLGLTAFVLLRKPA